MVAGIFIGNRVHTGLSELAFRRLVSGAPERPLKNHHVLVQKVRAGISALHGADGFCMKCIILSRTSEALVGHIGDPSAGLDSGHFDGILLAGN